MFNYYKEEIQKIYTNSFCDCEKFSGYHMILDWRPDFGNLIYGGGNSENEAWENAFKEIQFKMLSVLKL